MNRGTVIPLFLDGTHVGHSVESVDIILTLSTFYHFSGFCGSTVTKIVID